MVLTHDDPPRRISSWSMRMTAGHDLDIQSWVRAAFQISVDVLPADWDPALALRCGNLATLRATLESARLSASAILVINTAARTGPIHDD